LGGARRGGRAVLLGAAVGVSVGYCVGAGLAVTVGVVIGCPLTHALASRGTITRRKESLQ